MPFAKNLTTLMSERGMGVREAAKVAGVASSTIVDWRSGVASTDYQAIRRLAKALGTTMSYLLTGEDDTRPEGSIPAISEVFSNGGMLFDGYARIRIERLIPKPTKLSKGDEE